MPDRSSNDSSRPKHPKHGSHEQRHRGPPPGLALDPPDFTPAHDPEIPVARLDDDALRTIARLRHAGHEAYFVGGCVRDLLLDQKPKDFDLATSAHPGEVRAVFRNCRLIGRRFRLAHVYFRGGKVLELATFRKNPTELAEDAGDDDADLLITRDNVFGTAEEDAVRRDFTVNGLFYDPATGEVIDFVGGREDLEAHRIATIGDPEIRMREDPVRALRAIRFASRLGFTIAPDTFEAMRRHAGELARCAPARVLEEIFKILRCGGSARAFELMRAANALPFVLPSLAAALEKGDEPRRRSFFLHLAALDKLVRAGDELSEAVLLGALLMHLHDGERGSPDGAPEDGAPAGGGDDAAGRLLELLVQTSRLPRKVAERTRLALQAQRSLREPARKRRRRGRGLTGQPHFVDALQLLEITVGATGQGREILDRWTGEGEGGGEHERQDRHEREPEPRPMTAPGGEHVAPFEAAEAEEEEVEEAEAQGVLELDLGGGGSSTESGGQGAKPEGAPGGRRRRRGGRRRRRRGGSGPSAGGAPASGGGDQGGAPV